MQQWKNFFKKWSILGEVMDKSLVSCFFDFHSVNACAISHFILVMLLHYLRIH